MSRPRSNASKDWGRAGSRRSRPGGSWKHRAGTGSAWFARSAETRCPARTAGDFPAWGRYHREVITESDWFGPYEVHECLGAGGMAIVHRASIDNGAGVRREVALKRLLPQLVDDAKLVADF